MSKYSGVKIVNKWIDDNTFRIHEYTYTKNSLIYNELVKSLEKVLYNKRNKIKINRQTKFHDQVEITYTPNILYGTFTLYMNKYEKHKTYPI